MPPATDLLRSGATNPGCYCEADSATDNSVETRNRVNSPEHQPAQRRRLDEEGNFVRTRNHVAEELAVERVSSSLAGPRANEVTLGNFLQMYQLVGTEESNNKTNTPTTSQASKTTPDNKNASQDDDCAVCLKTLSPPYAQLRNCQHKLHVHCLALVATFQATCPMCRGDLQCLPARSSSHQHD